LLQHNIVPVKLSQNADHTRRIRKGCDVTKSDACAQRTHRTHAVCIRVLRGLRVGLPTFCFAIPDTLIPRIPRLMQQKLTKLYNILFP